MNLTFASSGPEEGGNTSSDVKQLETEMDNGRLVFMDNEHIFIVQNQKSAVVGKREDKIIRSHQKMQRSFSMELMSVNGKRDLAFSTWGNSCLFKIMPPCQTYFFNFRI